MKATETTEVAEKHKKEQLINPYRIAVIAKARQSYHPNSLSVSSVAKLPIEGTTDSQTKCFATSLRMLFMFRTVDSGNCSTFTCGNFQTSDFATPTRLYQ